jgi:hypothetical protein
LERSLHYDTCLHGGTQVHRILSSFPFFRPATDPIATPSRRFSSFSYTPFSCRTSQFSSYHLRFRTLSQRLVVVTRVSIGSRKRWSHSTYRRQDRLTPHTFQCISAIPPHITSSIETALFNKSTIDQEVYRCDCSLVHLYVHPALLIGRCTDVACVAVNHSAVPKCLVSGHEEPLVYISRSRI